MLVYCQPYGTIPEVFDAVFSGQGQLWQIQLVHEARPSVCYQIVNHWAEFLKTMNESDTSTPANMREFERSWSAKLVITNTDDEDCLGHVPYRIAFYVGGDTAAVANFAGLLDAVFKHRCEDEMEPRFASTVAVTWHVLEGEDISIKTCEMDCRTDVKDVKRADFSVAITDAQPPSRVTPSPIFSRQRQRCFPSSSQGTRALCAKSLRRRTSQASATTAPENTTEFCVTWTSPQPAARNE